MAEAQVTVKLSPSELKTIQTALDIARLESLNAANHASEAGNFAAKRQSTEEAAVFADLLGKLT